jgi:hypothetical protein
LDLATISAFAILVAVDEVKPIFWGKSTFVFRRTMDLHHRLRQRTVVPVLTPVYEEEYLNIKNF